MPSTLRDAQVGLSLTGPLSFTYFLTPQVSIITTVTGDARNIASIQIASGSVVAYSASLNQASPTATVGYEVLIGDAVIAKGATFTLTIPTQQQLGNVVFSGRVGSGQNPPQPFTAIIATWPLTSAV
ncbi:MAG TPA: hypothetical protein VGZ00_13055 [Candidatus Baltobacteraceae bacterium]|jgi:hypothetical protein|nr:hypothetical protein [Candidatus Baltobacteraceae bacterium]